VTKKFSVYITESAEQDILDIWNYICVDNKTRAKKFVARIESEIEKLKKYPARCSVINESEFFGFEYRQLVIGKYRIIFKIDADEVFIMRIIHGSRILNL
jgi:plasmid stabilization system protein ParE